MKMQRRWMLRLLPSEDLKVLTCWISLFSSQKVSLKERVFSSPRSSGTKGKGSPQHGGSLTSDSQTVVSRFSSSSPVLMICHQKTAKPQTLKAFNADHEVNVSDGTWRCRVNSAGLGLTRTLNSSSNGSRTEHLRWHHRENENDAVGI